MAGGGEINDRESSKSKTESVGWIDICAGIVRTSVDHGVAHCDEKLLVDILSDGAVMKDAADSAHTL